MMYTLRFFPSKCSLFHNYNVFGFCIIHILYTGCAKIKKIIPAPKVKHHTMKAQGTLLTLALVGSWCLLSLTRRLASGEGPPRVPWLYGPERPSGRRTEQNHSHRERP